MLVIRKAQLEALSAYKRQSFEDRMVDHLAEVFPEESRKMLDAEAGDGKVRELVHHGVEKAAGYEIRAERNVSLFIDLMVGIAPGFDDMKDTAWTRRILLNPDVPEDTKLDLIYDRLGAQARARRG